MFNIKKRTLTVIFISILFVKIGSCNDTILSRQKTESLSDSDSVKILLYRDSLLSEESNRVKFFYPRSNYILYTDTLQEKNFFESNAVSYYELFQLKKRIIPVKGCISSSLNRSLVYGNTVPLTKIYYGTSLLYKNYQNRFSGDEGLWTTEYNYALFNSGESIILKKSTKKPVSPELSFLWENGVFDENILYVSFSRLLTKNLIFNVFSNYRYFKGMSFTHDGNDVYSLYSNISSDTNGISHSGYNPLVNEFSCGMNLIWGDKNTSSLVRIKYGDLVNEIPLNTISGNILSHGQLSVYPLNILYTLSHNIGERFYLDVEGEYFFEPLRWKRAVGTPASPLQISLNERDLAGAISGGIKLDKIDSIAVQVNFSQKQIELFDTLDYAFYQITPKIAWKIPFSFINNSSRIELEGGYNIYFSDSILFTTPVWLCRVKSGFAGVPINIYAEQNFLSSPYSFDSLENISPLYNPFLRSGVEIEKEFSLFSLLLGYQWCSKIDTSLQKRIWITGIPPYFQPTSSIIISPQLKRIGSTAASLSLSLADKKPYLKLQSDLSFSFSPENLDELFDIRLSLVYWSERDTITFAGKTDWGRPVIDIGITTAIHIKTFRLFYKIDNILNRKFSFIPGYYSPGLNFRWGFSWYLQK